MALASALLQVMMDAVRKTARPMLRDFGEVSQLQAVSYTHLTLPTILLV